MKDLVQNTNRNLFLAWILPGLGWFLQLNVNYLMAAYSCGEKIFVLHLVSWMSMVMSVTGLYLGRKDWLMITKIRASKSREILSIGAISLGLIFFITIILGEVSTLMLESCI